jgi:hypothetical protein
MLTAKCIGRIENQRERAVVSHISRKTSEIWGPSFVREPEADPAGLSRTPHSDTVVADPIGTSISGMTTAGCVFYGRQIDHRILVEKARRRQREAADYAGLYRMIFRAR